MRLMLTDNNKKNDPKRPKRLFLQIKKKLCYHESQMKSEILVGPSCYAI